MFEKERTCESCKCKFSELEITYTDEGKEVCLECLFIEETLKDEPMYCIFENE